MTQQITLDTAAADVAAIALLLKKWKKRKVVPVEEYLNDYRTIADISNHVEDYISKLAQYEPIIKAMGSTAIEDAKQYLAKREKIEPYKVIQFKVYTRYMAKVNLRGETVNIIRRKSDGKVAIITSPITPTSQLAKNNEPATFFKNMWFDNIGFLSSVRGNYYDARVHYGIYVKCGDKIAPLFDGDSEYVFDSIKHTINNTATIGKYSLNMLHHYKWRWNRNDTEKKTIYQLNWGDEIQWVNDDTIVLDDVTKLIPKYEPNSCGWYLSVKMDDMCGKKTWNKRQWFKVHSDKPEDEFFDENRMYVDDFITKWKTASNEEKEKMRDGLGYNI